MKTLLGCKIFAQIRKSDSLHGCRLRATYATVGRGYGQGTTNRKITETIVNIKPTTYSGIELALCGCSADVLSLLGQQLCSIAIALRDRIRCSLHFEVFLVLFNLLPVTFEDALVLFSLLCCLLYTSPSPRDA